MLHKQRLVTSQLPVASRRWHFGTKNMLSRRYASGPRALSSDEERELDKALANRAVSSPFFVKGTQHLREPLKLFLSGPGANNHGRGRGTVTDAKSIEIGADGMQEDALQALIQAAEPATFGRYSVSVLDRSYRNALQIKAGGFGLSAVLPTPQMLHDISTLMQPAAPQIFAQLYNINVYGPGGFFFSHADTPTCAAQFGSLVVALPYEFEGGELVVRHAGQSATLKLGGGWNGEGSGTMRGSDSGPLLHYAAFFSDCIHEVLPVRSGHRVTLTFNLLLVEGEKCVVWPLDEGSIPVVAKLRELLAQGCTVGYVMQHKYATSLEGIDTSMFPYALKGDDRLLHAALCGDLGLKGTVRPLHFAKAKAGYGGHGWWEDDEYDDEGEIVKDDYLDYVFVGDDFRKDGEMISDYRLGNGSTARSDMKWHYTKAKDAAAVWIGLRDGGFHLRTSCEAWGNQPVTATIYSGVALLLKVPAWGTPERARAMAAVV